MPAQIQQLKANATVFVVKLGAAGGWTDLSRQTALGEIVGTTVPIIIDWSSFAGELEALRFVDRHGVLPLRDRVA